MSDPGLDDHDLRVPIPHDCDVYWFDSDIEDTSASAFLDVVEQSASSKNALLLISTFGGSADAAYQMARGLQLTYEDGKISVLIEDQCKSAGTLLAIGADELIMGDRAELGPLDVQVSVRDELGEMTSGLTLTEALQCLGEQASNLFRESLFSIRFGSRGQITTRTAAQLNRTSPGGK